MKRPLISIIFSIICIISFGQNDLKNSISSIDTLFRFNEGFYELGVPCGYKNQYGDTIIPIGKYFYCFTDTIIDFGIVMKKGEKTIAIDKNENELYEVYWFDNGPDYAKDNRFRIIKNNKIGYANSKGEIIIKPQFMCANQFKNGIAKVSYNCNYREPDNEGHSLMSSDEWFYIDIDGNKANEYDFLKSQLQGLLTKSIITDTIKSKKTIQINDKNSFNPNDYNWYLNGEKLDYESIKKIEKSTIADINIMLKLNQFQLDMKIPNDTNIILVSTKQGIQKCDSILSSKFSFYGKQTNSMDLLKLQFNYNGETVKFNELIGYENEIILKELNETITIEKITNNKP